MIQAIVQLLQSDSQLTAILPGGVHRAKEISRQETPAAYDANRELQPCALVRQETETPWGPYEHSARLYVTVWFYQRSGYDAIDAARKRVYALLHRQRITAEGSWGVEHANDLLDQEDPGLGVPMAMSRYVATILRSVE
jgi:hypothetical protein